VIWKRYKTREQGFIAQELYEIYPSAVSVGGDDPQTNPWAIDYGRLSPLLVKAIQELKAGNDDAEAQIPTLQARLAADEATIAALKLKLWM
jgi:hypothetical protein